MAVLVLDGDVLVDEATPICLPSEHEQIADSLLLAGAGYDRERPFWFHVLEHEMRLHVRDYFDASSFLQQHHGTMAFCGW